MSNLFDRLGGEAAVMAAVDLFYAKVLADPVTAPFFEGLDMDAQVKKQVAFMSRAFDGPDTYQGRDLRSAHAKLVAEQGLSDVHFDAVAKHLGDTLAQLGIVDELIREVLDRIEATRTEVLAG